MPKPMILVSLTTIPVSQYTPGWRDPGARSDFLRADFWRDLGQLLETGGFDMLFLADQLSIAEDATGEPAANLRAGGKLTTALDPMVTLGLIAGATSRIGLGATMSTTFHPPYAIARAMASLDQLSGGRAAWNIVTSTMDSDARNFGRPRLPERDARYDTAEQVTRAVVDLWQSWEPDALLLDPAGDFADPAKVHRTGNPLSAGPLTVPRSPQDRPILMQAGASERGRDFAARWAELVFGTGNTPQAMHAQRADLRRRAAAAGRDPDTIRYLAPVQPIVSATQQAANTERDRLESAIDLDGAVEALGRLFRVSGQADPDRPGTELLLAHRGNTGTLGFEDSLFEVAESEGLTVGQLARRYAMCQLNPQPVGDAATVASYLETLIDTDAADGFIVMSPVTPRSMVDLVTHLSPELRRRGRLTDDGTPRTLRERLFGEPQPTSTR
ncbi:NtaA/DmoA family FMN-dependent monooxygenase [Parenemella sanctibonifatiensis]|uniref:Dibenzothiophene desulfurization enzyme n=1 Tax=Parenemella sanctibonifatiensis TaxID=2016505 RepID=A0A255ES60_9ACTN|nr:NtaA/DmoA family FMN-dependent monooxygenase [Parenemella sanctibonifatiensis]OYN92425.1 dibenzothiophene desulfurization enzyme [Parenemella sanctibonifatiensis]